MIKIYDTKNCAKCRLTERLFKVANGDFKVVKPHNSDIQRFREQAFNHIRLLKRLIIHGVDSGRS